MRILIISCVLIAATICSATTVRKCANGPRKLETEEVSITKCKTGTCKLRRKTTAEVVIAFTPEKDIQQLTTKVNAFILNVPFPFIGVDGKSACDNLFAEDGATKVGCPLKAGTKYVYKNGFPVEEFYPPVSLVVHWALEAQDKTDVICFEVPARIV